MSRNQSVLSTALLSCIATFLFGAAAAVAQFQPTATQTDRAGSATRPAQANSANASSGLHVVDNPSGGQFVYGSLTGMSTVPDAMVYMLQQVHGHFGDKPQIGKFFQAKGDDSTATFFSLTAKNQGNIPVTGMLIVYGTSGGSMSAAVLYDKSAHFATSQPEMMRTLSAAWHQSADTSGGSAGGSSGGSGGGSGGARNMDMIRTTNRPAPASSVTLRTSSGGDNSASIGLAPGWRVTQVTGGSIRAEGPSGEQIALGLIVQGIHDPNAARSPYPLPRSAAVQFTASPNGDLFQAYTSIINQSRQSQQQQPASFRLISQRQLPATTYQQRVIEAIFEVDLHDGKGVRSASAQVGAMIHRGSPTWAMTLSTSNAPKGVADEDAPMFKAMLATYRQDGGVINQENKVVLDRIQAQGAASRQQAADIDSRREASASSYDSHMKAIDQNAAAFDQHMDDIDRQSKMTQDYILDKSVVHDNNYMDVGGKETGTVSNGYADSLVKYNPDRFQIVANQDMVRGRDY